MRDLLHDRGSRRQLVTLGIIVALVGVVLVWLVPTTLGAKREADAANVASQQNARAAEANAEALARANHRLVEAGGTPVPTPSVAIGLPGPTGPTGPAPSAAAIGQAVAAFCSTTSCGSGPSVAQVAAAVSTYCDARGQCRGAVGSSGSPGADGAAGTNGANGADGASATPDQVAAAVATYCATGACVGPAGANGTDGTSGENGTDGQPPVSWTYVDPLGMSHTCSRDDPFDPTAPTYTCT